MTAVHGTHQGGGDPTHAQQTAGEHAKEEGKEEGVYSVYDRVRALLAEIIHVHFYTRLEHDIEHADHAEGLDGGTALQELETMRTYRDADQDKSYDARDADLTTDHGD